MSSTSSYSQIIKKLKEELASADAVLIGAGAGLSTAAGMYYEGERFMHHFADFYERYGIADMYSGGFYPFKTQEEYWAWWSRHIWINRYEPGALPVYRDLLAAVEDKDYFVITTNVDHQFQLAGFDKERLYYMQGDYGLWQCSVPCHQKTYDNFEVVKAMVEMQQDMAIPSELVPRCPKCGEPMTMNLRIDNRFVEDEGWHDAAARYQAFVERTQDKKLLLLECGVGANTPGIIKYPFWRFAYANEKATYACLNLGETYVPPQIKERSLAIDADMAQVVRALRAE